MDVIKFILDIFGIAPQDIPKYILFIIIFGLMMWFIFKKQFSPLKKAVRQIETFCTRLSTFLMSRPEIPDGSPSFNPALEISSPVKLKSIAYQILKDSMADAVVKDNKKLLYETMETFGGLRTAFDVQNAAKSTLISAQNNQIFDNLKLFAYQYPEYKTDKEAFKINFKMLLDIIAIYLRDLYLEEHTSIPRDWGEGEKKIEGEYLLGDSNKVFQEDEIKELSKSSQEPKEE